MSIIPSRIEIAEELEQINKDYPSDGERFEVMADYVEQLAAEAAGHRYEQETVSRENVLLTTYDALGDMFGLNVDRQAAAIAITAFLSAKYNFTPKE